jgi:hypothetical protein
VNPAVFVVIGIENRTALIHPIVRGHDAAVEDSASRYWYPYQEKKNNKLAKREMHLLSLTHPKLQTYIKSDALASGTVDRRNLMGRLLRI